MTRQLKIFWLGMLAYAISFVLTAVGPSSLPMRGYFCAAFALVYPFQVTPRLHGGPFDERAFEYASLLVSGWINPLFLITAFLDLAAVGRPFVAIMRVLLPVMIPFCWVVFLYEHFYPREGHLLWIVAMLLVLFSRDFAKISSPSLLSPPIH